MNKITVKIDGMMCGMCENHVSDAIRNAFPGAKKVTASKSRKEATFLMEEMADKDKLESVINATGYTCTGVTSAPAKKTLFGWK